MLRNIISHEPEASGSMLWVLAYTWLLRVPSEVRLSVHFLFPTCALARLSVSQALPTAVYHDAAQIPPEARSAVWREGDVICFRIRKRKNRPLGSGVLKRGCICQGSPTLCPVHALWEKFLGRLPSGSQPWQGLSSSNALAQLRACLLRLGIPQANAYGTHSFRRGHARVRHLQSLIQPVCIVSLLLAGSNGRRRQSGTDSVRRTVAQLSLPEIFEGSRPRDGSGD